MTDCAAPRHGEPEPAEPHAWLCRPCRTGLRSDLLRLPGWWAVIEERLEPSAAIGFGGTDNSIGLPVNETVVEWRSQVRHDLGWWTAEISRQSRAERPSDARVAALAGYLCGHVRWASFRDWAGEMAGTFADLAHRARRITDPHPPAAFLIPPRSGMNRCPRCGTAGMLRVTRRRPLLAACGSCGHEWDATQWETLRRDIIRTMEAA